MFMMEVNENNIKFIKKVAVIQLKFYKKRIKELQRKHSERSRMFKIITKMNHVHRLNARTYTPDNSRNADFIAKQVFTLRDEIRTSHAHIRLAMLVINDAATINVYNIKLYNEFTTIMLRGYIEDESTIFNYYDNINRTYCKNHNLFNKEYFAHNDLIE